MKPVILRMLAFAVVFVLFFFDLGDSVQVSTKNGILEGKVEKSRGGREFFSFYRVPYAEPPIGDLRFEVSYDQFRILSTFY